MDTRKKISLLTILILAAAVAACGISTPEDEGGNDGGPGADAAACDCDKIEGKCDNGCQCDELCTAQPACTSDSDCVDVCPEAEPDCRICSEGKCGCPAYGWLTKCEEGRENCGDDGYFCKPIEPPCDCNDDTEFCDEDCQCDLLCGTRRDEEPCKTVADCEENLICEMPEDNSSVGFCINSCNPMSRDMSQCPPEKICIAPDETNPGSGICIQMCDISAPEECGAGRTCYWIGQGESGICFHEGEKGMFEQCESMFDCEGGLLCPSSEGDNNGIRRCIELCSPEQGVECGEEDYSCIKFEEDSENGVCIKKCADPAGNDCPENFTCFPTQWDTGSTANSVCMPAGDKPEGSACTNMFGECGDGMVCLSMSEQGQNSVCVKLCLLDPQSGCAEDQLCLGGPESEFGFCLTSCADPFNNTCAEGHACYWMMQDSYCFPEGNKEEGEECSAPFECKQGYTCIGACAKLCNEPIGSHKCDEGQYCFVPGGRTGICIDECDDPVTGAGCPGSSQGCYLLSPSMPPYCISAGSNEEGAECGGPTDCLPGYFCTRGGGQGESGECMNLCDPNDASTCGEGQACDLNQQLPEEYGLCQQ